MLFTSVVAAACTAAMYGPMLPVVSMENTRSSRGTSWVMALMIRVALGCPYLARTSARKSDHCRLVSVIAPAIALAWFASTAPRGVHVIGLPGQGVTAPVAGLIVALSLLRHLWVTLLENR